MQTLTLTVTISSDEDEDIASIAEELAGALEDMVERHETDITEFHFDEETLATRDRVEERTAALEKALGMEPS